MIQTCQCANCKEFRKKYNTEILSHHVNIISNTDVLAEKPATPPITLKFDQGKPDLSHISYELVELVAQVREFGAKKYSRGNWKNGFKVTRSLAAALRHIFLFLSGQTLDSESGLSHLGHAVCSLEHAIYDMKHNPQNDDRDNVVAAKPKV